MRAVLLLGLICGTPAFAVPVTMNYTMVCFQDCNRYGTGDAKISVTYDNASFSKWDRFENVPLLDFSVDAGTFHADLSEMKVSYLGGQWGNSATGNIAFNLWASQNDVLNEVLPGKTVNIFNAFFGGGGADLGLSGGANSIGDYSTYEKLAPIPLPPSGLMLGAIVAVGAIAGRLGRSRSRAD